MIDYVAHEEVVDMKAFYKQAFHTIKLEFFDQIASRLRDYLNNPEIFIEPILIDNPIKSNMISRVIINPHFKERNFRVQYNYYDPYRAIDYPYYVGSTKVVYYRLQTESEISNDSKVFQEELEQIANQITDTIAEFEYRRFPSNNGRNNQYYYKE